VSVRTTDDRGPAETVAQLRRYRQVRDPAELDRLVRRFQPLVRKLALRYVRAGEPLEDLEQVGALGLVKAIERFDPDRGFAFTSFAVPTILGEIKRSIRDTAWSAHVPRSVQERVTEMRQAAERFAGRHGRAPTVAELSGLLACTEEQVVDAMSAADTLSPVSLDSARHQGEEEDGTLIDRLGSEDGGYERVIDRAAIASGAAALSEMQRQVLRLRFEEDLKQSEIAAALGCSQMQVSRLLRSGLQRLSTVAGHKSGA
jgi:RNA polymerase sigma-B factor